MKAIFWCYDDEDWINANKELNKIEYLYNVYNGIQKNEDKSIISKNRRITYFENGDIWRIIPAFDSQRGQRCNISYISRKIPKDFINTVIDHCTTAFPYRAFNYF